MSQRQPYQFPTTRWTEVERAGQQGATGADALARLLSDYLEPLRAHLVRHKRLPPQQADDLLQSFIADKVLERDLFGAAVRDRGKFRTFLLVALDRHVSNQIRDLGRQVRSTDGHVSLAEAPDVADGAPGPSAAFELAWARQVLMHAVEKTQAECVATGRADLWAIFEGRVLTPTLEGAEPMSYELLIERHAIASVDAASNLLVTAKRMFARSLRGVVGEYMGEGGEIEPEIAELREILARGR